MLTPTQQVGLILQYLKTRILDIYTPEQRAGIEKSEDWRQFSRRMDTHFPKLMNELDSVYGNNEALLPMLEMLLAQAWQSYSQRSASLKNIDIERENNPDWILSNKQVGGVCYVDLFVGDLKGLKDKIPYFQELGLTYLHLMPLFKCPEGKSDGGYAVSSYRDVKSLPRCTKPVFPPLSISSSTTPPTNTNGRNAAPPATRFSTISTIFSPTAGCPTNTTAPCAKSSPTSTRAASRNWKTDAGCGRRSIPSNGT